MTLTTRLNKDCRNSRGYRSDERSARDVPDDVGREDLSDDTGQVINNMQVRLVLKDDPVIAKESRI